MTSWEEISKDIKDLNITVEQPPNNRKHILPISHETFTKINHILGHKTSLSKFKKIQAIQSMYSDQMELN